MEKESEKKSKKVLFGFLSSKAKAIIAACIGIIAVAGGLIFALLNHSGEKINTQDVELIEAFWPDAFVVQAYDEPPFADDPNRTNNAFNIIDFGEQGSNGWFFRFGDYKKPQRSERCTMFDGSKYSQPGATGLEIKNNFVHTADRISPILEWRAAEKGNVNITVSYVKNVNGDANPSYPDGVQLLVYKGSELLELQNVPIYTTEENFAQIRLENVAVEELESLYFVVNPSANNAYDGGSLYVAIADVNAQPKTASYTSRSDNNADSIEDFGPQGNNGWTYMYGTSPSDAALASHEVEGEYINCTSPSLTIKKDFIHPSLNHNAILGWVPAVNGNIDLRIKYTKFEQNDGMPDFPDGVKLKAYKNDTLIYEEDVAVFAQGENLVKYRIPSLSVTTADRLYFMVDCAGNSSYDGGALDVTIIDIRGATTENDIGIDESEIRQNVANVMTDFGPQGSNGWFFQTGYGDDPFHAYNMSPYDKGMDRYFSDNWLEIKRDYVNTGEHDSSAVIKWKVAQNGTVSVKAAYTKMKNEDANPAWPDGTRVSLYLNNQLLAQQTFAPEVNREITKRLDIPSLKVNRGDYITMVVNGINNNAYDGGKYEFSIMSTSGLVGNTERNVPATYDGKRVNFASTKDDFGKQGYNGWYYQYGYNRDPFFAVNIEKCENNEKYYTKDGVEIKKDYIVPGPNGKSANVKWIAAETGKINIDLQYTKLKNEDANPAWPDGVTVLLMKNGSVLRSEYFAPLTDREVTKDLSIDGVSVNKGDAITMIVDPGANAAYDGGNYRFVIEDANKVPTVKVGNNDNFTNLGALSSIEQGTDGWWFLEGTQPSGAKVLTKKTEDGLGYESRRSEGLVMKKDMVHAGATLDPIYQWLPGEDGRVNIKGTYIKWGQEDPNPNWPDGVTVKVWHNNELLYTQKVTVKRGDGNDNVINFTFNNRAVKRGDKLSFQICHDGNWAWDGGNLSVVITPVEPAPTPANRDNNTVLLDDFSGTQGYEGWYYGFCDWDGKNFSMIAYDKANNRYYDGSKIELKKDYVAPGNGKNAAYKWIVAKDGTINVKGNYTKFANNGDPEANGTTVRIFVNGEEKEWMGAEGNFAEDKTSYFDKVFEVKAGDVIIFAVNPEMNDSLDGGRLAIKISEVKPLPEPYPEDRTNNTVLVDDFGDQGYQGWYYGSCDWNGASFKAVQNKDGDAYVGDDGLELKKDFVHPGPDGGQSAAYKWVAAEDGTIYVTGEYVKFANEKGNGTTFRIILNDDYDHPKFFDAGGTSNADRTLSFNESFEVKKGDVLIFAINPEGNNEEDGGRLSVKISDTKEADPEPYPEDRTNNTVLAEDFGDQGYQGWFYGYTGWDGKDFKLLGDKDGEKYTGENGLELKADFVHPGPDGDHSAAYKWVVAEDGTIKVEGEYTKEPNSDGANANGVTLRVVLNDDVKVWRGDNIAKGGITEPQTVTFDETFEVKKGDILIFAINPEGNNEYDGGKLSVKISDVKEEEPEPYPEDRTNNTVLAEDFGDQGSQGWFYGYTGWEGKGFKLLGDRDGEKYTGENGLELKADFVHPGPDGDHTAAYKWVVAEDGTIKVEGEYTKEPNSDGANANGVTLRVVLNDDVKVWRGDNIAKGGITEPQTVTFDETFEVKKGDILIFAINPEGNNEYDGGKLSVKISDVKEEEPEPYPEDRTNNTVLAEDFGDQGSQGWFYGYTGWEGKGFKLLGDRDGEKYTGENGLELKADFVHPGPDGDHTAAYKWVVAEDGTIKVEGEYTKEPNSDGANANGVTLRVVLNDDVKVWRGDNIAKGGITEPQTVTFDETFEVKKGDILIFAINPEGNNEYDGGKLSVKISDVKEEEPEKEYSVTYKYDGEYPEAVTATLPADDQKYKDDDEVTAKAPSAKTVKGEKDGQQGTWKFNSWDAESKKVNGTDVEFKGTWTFTTDEVKYSVTYVYEGEYPDAVMSTLPNDETEYDDGATVTAEEPSSKSVKAEKDGKTGVWDFDGWKEPSKKIEGEDIEFTGTWTFTADRTNNTVLAEDFGDQGSQGWFYGYTGWEGKGFKLLGDRDGEKYTGENGLELKADFVHPGPDGDHTAAYKWVVAEDGTIKVEGEYTKEPNSDGANANGVTLRVVLNDDVKVWRGDNIAKGGITEPQTVTFDETFEVKKGDILIFAINPEGNNEYDGGKLSVKISDVKEEEPEPYPEDRTNNTVLAEDFGDQGSQGWFYGYTGWEGKGFKLLGDRDGEKYTGENGLELKADFVHPGPDGDHTAAYKWVVAEDGTIKVEGEYTKEPNSDGANANGVTLRVVLNDDVKVWRGDNIAKGGITEPQTVTFDETFEVKKGDILIFAINPEGNNEYDGGKLSVKISDVKEEEPEPEPEKEYSVTYKYDGEYPDAVMSTLPNDETEYDDGATVTAEEPSSKSVKAEKDGKTGVWDFDGWKEPSKKIEGEDIEFTGTWTFTADRTNNTVLAEDFGDQGSQGWFYGYTGWEGKDFKLLGDRDGEKYTGENGLELKADFVHPGPDGDHTAAYKWVVAEDGTIKVEGEYTKEPNSDGANANGVTLRVVLNDDVKVWRGDNIAKGGITEPQTVTFDETFEVKKGDILIFAINPEGNNEYDGGRLEVTISETDKAVTKKMSVAKPKTTAKATPKVTEETVEPEKEEAAEVTEKPEEQPEEPKETAEPVKPEETVEPVKEEAEEPEAVVEEVPEEAKPEEQKEETAEEPAEPETIEETNE